jgi:hypothetical protein
MSMLSTICGTWSLARASALVAGPDTDDLIAKLEDAPIRRMDPPPDLQVEQWLIDTYQQHWREHWRRPVME